MEVDQAQRLDELTKANQRPREAVSDLTLGKLNVFEAALKNTEL